jgi:hypothetical protein
VIKILKALKLYLKFENCTFKRRKQSILGHYEKEKVREIDNGLQEA